MRKIIAISAMILLHACAKPAPFEETSRAVLEAAQPGVAIAYTASAAVSLFRTRRGQPRPNRCP